MNENDIVERAREASPPWLIKLQATSAELYETAWRAERAGMTCRVLRGAKMRSLQGLWDEFGAALQFPDYFGENWAALDECLTDLSWLPGSAYLLLITDAAEVLSNEPQAVRALVEELLERVAAEWAETADSSAPWDRRPIPFHVGLQAG
jgi:RNAse (barnase) inhibitor barstar